MSLFYDRFENFTGELKESERIVYKIKPCVEIFVAFLQSILVIFIPTSPLFSGLSMLLLYACAIYLNAKNVPFWLEAFVKTSTHVDTQHFFSNCLTIITILVDAMLKSPSKLVFLSKLFWFAQISYHGIMLLHEKDKNWIGASIGSHALIAYRLCEVEWSKVNPVYIMMLVFGTAYEIIHQHKYYKNKGMSVDHTGHLYGLMCGFVSYMITFLLYIDWRK